MPQIAGFRGIIIMMYFKDHNPPHFHAAYGDDDMLVQFSPTVQVYSGGLPRRQRRVVLDWAVRHHAELMVNWQLAHIPTTPLNWILF